MVLRLREWISSLEGCPAHHSLSAGKQLGNMDERNLFPAMIRVVDQIRPSAIVIENVRAFWML